MRRTAFPLLALCLTVVADSAPAIAQSASSSVSGTVTDAGGQPLADVCVEVFGDSGGDTTLTDGEGRYVVEDLGAGEHLVSFNTCADPRPGLAAEYYDDAASVEGAEPVVLADGEQRTGIDAALQPGATISGTVTEQDTGDPLADICVVVFAEESGLLALDITDADGSYAMDTLHAGDYLVSFNDCADPFTHQAELYDDVSEQEFAAGEQPTTVTVEAGGTASGIDAQLEEGGSLRGTVTGLHNGEPLSLVCVALTAPGAAPAETDGLTFTGFEPTLDADPTPGEYVFPGVEPGSYDVVVNPVDVCGDDGYTEQRASGPARQVVQGEVVEGVDVVLAPRPSISFACFTSDGPATAFSDVPADSVHAPAIRCAADYGIAAGRADGTYGPAAPVTRDQMAAFVARTLAAAGVQLPTDPADAFTDDGQSVHHLAINQLAALGVVGGKGGGRYAPADPVSRDQMATFLVNAYEEATGFSLRAAGDAFTDDEQSIHEDRINKAATAGLTAGSDPGRYVPQGSVRRDQMATFVARLLDRVQRDQFATTTSEGGFQASSTDAPAGSRRSAATGTPTAGLPWPVRALG